MKAPKRFWKEVTVGQTEGGFDIQLDGRPIKTPAKNVFVAPTRALAEAVAEEWHSQEGAMNPAAMPLTRYVNSTIDGITPRREEIVGMVAAYGESDLLCYRAEHPERLIARQAERWDPLLDWVRERYDAPLILASGVMPVTQPAPSVARLRKAVASHDDFALASLHDLVAISGSLVLGLAVSEGRLEASEALSLSRLDDDWQSEEWGVDEDAAAVAAIKAGEYAAAARLLELYRKN